MFCGHDNHLQTPDNGSGGRGRGKRGGGGDRNLKQANSPSKMQMMFCFGHGKKMQMICFEHRLNFCGCGDGVNPLSADSWVNEKLSWKAPP